MKIRQAEPDDLDAIEDIWKELMRLHGRVDEYFRISPTAEANHRDYATLLIEDKTRRVLVADYDGRLLGYVVAEIVAYPPIYRRDRYGHIGAIAVAESARRIGIGRQLLDAALDWFREQGLERAECEVAVRNEISRSFWAEAGFRSVVETMVFDL